MKCMNISFDIISLSSKKKMICIVSLLCLISLISSPAVEISKSSKGRNLQYSLGSIYYQLEYPMNVLTGTGDRLKDVPYRVKCKLQKCETGCCVGEIDNMTCGAADDCTIYLDASKIPYLLTAIIIPIGIFVIFIILLITFLKVYKLSIGLSFCFALGCLTIVLIPCVAYFVYKESKDENKNDKSKEG